MARLNATGSIRACRAPRAVGDASAAAVEEEVAPALVGHDATDQRGVDATLLDLDGTESDDTRFVPSPLDASVRDGHGGGGAEVERELDEIRDEAERLAGRRDG